MAHYAYKCACYDIDYPKFQQLVKQFEEQEGREFDGDSNYDGDNWYIMEMWIRELRAENERLRASPASAPEGWKDFLQDLTQKISEAMYHTPDYFHRDMVRLAHRAHKLLAAAPTPPSTEDRKAVGTAHITPGASGFTMCVFNATDVPVGTVLYTMQDDKSCAK